ncbi:MAG: Gfo/Idh/MocA family oxidoreductase [Caldilineaceae bacterium]|nr:Gfo/Idh/MocA family oxidoreductase [Caldilineaceae bacterium]
MSDTKWRVGVIGAGFIVNYAHIPEFQRLDGVEVVAIADLNRARAEELAAARGVPHVYEDYEKMLAEQQPNIVVVATPNIFHQPMAKTALESGANVLLEKPMALTYADAVDIVETAKANDRVLTVGTHYRYAPGSLAARHQADEGFFGHIYAARAVMHRRTGIPGFGSWFTRKELSGGGVLLDLGVHALDCALFLMDFPDPVTVSASSFSAFGPRGLGLGGWGSDINKVTDAAKQFNVDDLTWATIRFADDRVLQFQVAWASHGADQIFTELYGTEGGARIDADEGLKLYEDLNGAPVDIAVPLPNGDGGTYRPLISNFVDYLNGDASAHIITTDQALLSVKIVDAIQRSAETGREVVLG